MLWASKQAFRLITSKISLDSLSSTVCPLSGETVAIFDTGEDGGGCGVKLIINLLTIIMREGDSHRNWYSNDYANRQRICVILLYNLL